MSEPTITLEHALPRALGAEEQRETHGSWVFLTPTRAYKLKKPVRFGFVDLTTPAARRLACEEEVRLNRELAPDLVLGVRAVLPAGDSYALGAADDPAAVDWVVEMRRFDERRTMAALAARGALTLEDAAAAGARIADFHASARRLAPLQFTRIVVEQWGRNLDELSAVAGESAAEAAGALRRFAGTFVTDRRVELDARAAAGLVRDVHGDLRTDHVLVDDGITLLDRLEFDPALREIDVADDVAFLAMDLEARGVRWAAEAMLAAYRAAGGDAGDDALVAFYGTYRALVRAKVELLRAEQLTDEDAAARCRDRADGMVRLAEHLAWRARRRPVLVVCGPPASGKSTLAAALATRLRVPVLSSDAIRKELLEVPLAAAAPPAAYRAEAREAVYDELARRLRALPASQGAVVDATFGTQEIRARFVSSLDDVRRHRLRWAECRAPVETRVARAAARSADGAHGSDADAVLAARLGEEFEALDEIEREHRLTVDTTEPAAANLRRIGTWVDGASADELVQAAAR